ncbi:hypothetical protein GCM10007901_05210 [Dyella acidisoli]|uniref:Fibronectin type-III domain-containing protein n=1 Tax=Dyella acidisoli TaxID=1867834 RepID=A0ABQ5XIN8_9GAMM|nr:hypothetical protein GCM10007901_05210 [Dyella acidisoli]
MFACLSLLVTWTAWSQTVTPESEFKQLIRVNEDIHPLGENPFGENVSLYNGSLSFQETDIDLAGTGPRLQLVRTFAVADTADPYNRAFVDWRLELPHIETLVADADTFFSSSTDRCSNFRAAPTITVTSGSSTQPNFYFAGNWWRGYQLIVPGQGSQDLLKRDAAGNALSPQMTAADGSPMSFGIVTKQHWQVSCLAKTSNGMPGEGFLVVSPAGEKYWMDWLVLQSAKNVGFAQPGFGGMARHVAMMMVSREEDRFGNSLSYSYDGNGNLTAIQASDGRGLSLSYEFWQGPDMTSPTTRIHSVTLQPSNAAARTWVYGYANTPVRLASVTLPNGSSWSFNLGSFRASSESVMILYDAYDGCHFDLHPEAAVTATGTITHPSGLTGTFTTQTTIRGRSYVPRACDVTSSGHTYLEQPDVYASTALVSKQFSGAGLSGSPTWTYAYSPANASWGSDCASGCATTAWTDVTDPSGNSTRYTFSNRYDATESQLLSTSLYSGGISGSPVRSETLGYAPTTTGPWPTHLGSTLLTNMNAAQLEQLSPQNLRVIQQDGDTYTWQVQTFDAYAHPSQVVRSNSIAGQSAITKKTTYLNDLPHWVLGLLQETDNLSTGEVETLDTYNLTNVTLQSRARFGQVLMSYAFNGAGQLASFTDGNSHTTSLSNYKRGIPQSIGYPDGTSESLAVDDFGQITAVTDQAGHTTNYNYDAIGRVTQVAYPSGDSVAWYTKQIAYNYATSAERGVAGGHWDRTITIGNAKTVTYFDAMLRPVLTDASSGSADITTTGTYDWRDQATFTSYPVTGSPDIGSVTSGTHHGYDSLGRETQTQADSELGALTTATVYLAGAGEQITDPKGNVTTTYFQVFDEPTYNNPIRVNAPAGITQSIARDLYGDPTTITQFGTYGSENDSVTKTLVYDTYHRVCRTTEPESGSTVMAYDAANNLVWSAEGLSISGSGCGQDQVASTAQTARTYDAMNRVLTIAPPTGTQSTIYTYDALGNVKTAVSDIATQTFNYNTRNLLTSQTLSIAGTSYNWGIGYNYDGYAHLNAVGYPASNGLSEGVAYNPDALGRATQVGSYASGITYFANGQVAGFNFANGASYVAQQNGRQLLNNFSYGIGSALNLSEDLSYDSNGNITNVNDLVNGQRTKAFGYDALNRLTSATANNLYGTESYTYDALNNLRSRLTGGNTLTFNYDAANHLANVMQAGSTVTSYGYDVQGNRNRLSSNGTTTQYNFDAENRLLQIPGLENYSYDASGRRVAKTTAGDSATYYFYDQAGQLMFQYNPATYLATNYIYLGRQLIAKNVTDVSVLTAAQVNVSVALVGVPSLSADGQQLIATIDISNHGSATLTSSGPHPVHLGTHLVDGSGNILVNDLTRANIPDIAPGAHAAVTITVPANQVLGTGKSIQYLPVQEGVAWFNAWGTQPVTLGPFTTCSASNSTGLCNTSNRFTAGQVNVALSLTSGPTLSADGQTLTSVIDISNLGMITLSSSGTYPVHLGSRLIDASGNSPANDVSTRSNIPDIAPGTHTAVTITMPSNGVLGTGNSILYVPVQEGLAWFTDYGTTPIKIAPLVNVNAPISSFTGSFSVNWGGVAGAATYNLQEQVDSGNWSTVQASSATSWSTSGRGNGTYGYRVQACGSGGCGPWSTVQKTGVLLPPPAPASISTPVSSFNGSFSVSWSSVTTPATVQYILQEQVDNGAWTTVQASSVTSWSTSGRGNGTYHYRVQACNAAGCSNWSSTASVGVLLPPSSAPTLSVPGNSYNGSYTVSWSSVSTPAAVQYTLQEQANGGGWATVQSNSATSWSTSGRGNGTYGYRVQACNVAGCGPWSSTANITVILPPSSAPSGLSVSASGPSSNTFVTVTWNQVATATQYNVEQTNPGNVVSMPYSGNSTGFGQVMRVNGTVKFRVQACNAGGCSGWSGYVSILLASGN